MPRKPNTKELILNAALDLFSTKGYDGVGLREIANVVQIRESAIYRHFSSKRVLFEELLALMYDEYELTATALGVGGDANGLIDKYANISEKDLLQISYGFFLYFAKDQKASKFRKILTMEQYRSQWIRDIYVKLYSEDVLAFNTIIFKGLVDAGIMVKADPKIIALHFYAPIFLLLTNFDENKVTLKEALDILTAHVKQFRRLYHQEYQINQHNKKADDKL